MTYLDGDEASGSSCAREKPGTNAEACVRLEASLVAAMRSQPGFTDRVVGALREGLDATKSQYDMVEKRWVSLPDHRVRLDAAKLCLAYLEGLPTQTVVSASVGGSGDLPRLSEVLRKAPNARRVLESFAARLGPAGPVVDVDPAGGSGPSGGA